MSTPSFLNFVLKVAMEFSLHGSLSLPVALPYPVHLIRESGGHDGKLDLGVFSWLTGKNLSLPVPVEKERIVACRP